MRAYVFINVYVYTEGFCFVLLAILFCLIGYFVLFQVNLDGQEKRWLVKHKYSIVDNFCPANGFSWGTPVFFPPPFPHENQHCYNQFSLSCYMWMCMVVTVK